MSQAVMGFALLRGDAIFLNGEKIFSAPHNTLLQQAYEKLAINYPKFYKMDNLSKTGFLTAEELLRDRGLADRFQPFETGIVLSTANSSLDTDYRFGLTSETAPSPSLFVYTLPNILIGELCIRHRIKGESACFAFDIFDPAFQTKYINTLFETGKVKACIGGWADFFQDKFEAFFYLVENGVGIAPHNEATIAQLYKNPGI